VAVEQAYSRVTANIFKPMHATSAHRLARPRIIAWVALFLAGYRSEKLPARRLASLYPTTPCLPECNAAERLSCLSSLWNRCTQPGRRLSLNNYKRGGGERRKWRGGANSSLPNLYLMNTELGRLFLIHHINPRKFVETCAC
jgi:hypothetical protein